MPERVLRWVTPVPSNRKEFDDAIAAIKANPARNEYLPFGELPMIHFASLTVFDKAPHDEDPLLVFESNIDAPTDAYVDKLVDVGRKGLNALFAGSTRYPAGGSAQQVKRYFGSLRMWFHEWPPLYHNGHPGRTTKEIRGDVELRRSIAHEFDRLKRAGTLSDLSPEGLRDHIRTQATCPIVPWPSMKRAWHDSWENGSPDVPTPLGDIHWVSRKVSWSRLVRTLMLAGIALVVGLTLVDFLLHGFEIPTRVTIALYSAFAFFIVRVSAPDTKVFRGVIVALGTAVVLITLFRFHLLWCIEAWRYTAWIAVLSPVGVVLLSYVNIARTIAVTRAEPVPTTEEEKKKKQEELDSVRLLLAAEDQDQARGIYNHVAGLSVIEERFLLWRLVRTYLVLQFLNLFYRTQYVKGKLATIPSIHFAQWSLVRGHRLLFLTNYDGGADSYLDDFFDSLAGGVAYIWHDTKPFPHTTDPRILKRWVRRGQTLASVRYRSPVYDNLPVSVIVSNAYIRKRLIRGRGDASARRWIARFTTTPIEPAPITRFVTWLKERFMKTS